MGHGVSVRAVRDARRADVDNGSLREDLHSEPFGEVEIVLDQCVLRAVSTAHHARTAAHTPGARRAAAAEVGIGHGLPGLAQEHAHAGLGVRVANPDLRRILLEQQVGGGVLVVGRDAEHSLGLVVMRGELALPVRELRPLAILEERPAAAVERIRVPERTAADPAAGGDEHVLEHRQAQDALQSQLRHPVVAPELPRRLREVLVLEAPATFEHGDPVSLLGEPQRCDAPAEAGPDHQPVVVEA